MIDSILVEFKKINNKTWSNSEYQVFLGENQTTQYKPIENGLKIIDIAKKRIDKTEKFLAFIKNNNPNRQLIVFYLKENEIRYSDYALNSLEIYF